MEALQLSEIRRIYVCIIVLYSFFCQAHFVNTENLAFHPFAGSAGLSPCRMGHNSQEGWTTDLCSGTCSNFTTSLISFAVLDSLHPKLGKESKQVKPWFTTVGLSRKEGLDSKGEPPVQTQVSEAVFRKQTLEWPANSVHFAHLPLNIRQISRHQQF